uniref:Uncharacterized protein n=1 Tax=Setaria italica TaxID=4555 RepID=K3ZCZ6_SETIT
MGVPTPLPSLVGSSSLLALPFSLFASLSLGSRGDGTGFDEGEPSHARPPPHGPPQQHLQHTAGRTTALRGRLTAPSAVPADSSAVSAGEEHTGPHGSRPAMRRQIRTIRRRIHQPQGRPGQPSTQRRRRSSKILQENGREKGGGDL